MKFRLKIIRSLAAAVLRGIHAANRVLLDENAIQGCLDDLRDIRVVTFCQNFNLLNQAFKCFLLTHAGRFTHLQEFNGDSLVCL